MASHGRNHLGKLTARSMWLQATIDTRAGSPGSLGHAAAELAALQWALPVLGDMLDRNATDARDTHKQRELAEHANVTARAIVAVLDSGNREAYDELMAQAPKRVQNLVEARRFGAPVPQAAPL